MTSNSKGLILDRRSLIAGASALGLAGMFGRPTWAQETPVRGGVFIMGIKQNACFAGNFGHT